MPTFLTRSNPTPLYNINGGIHGSSPLRASQVNVTGFIVNLSRGAAYRLESGKVYILLSDLALNSDPQPFPTPIPTDVPTDKIHRWRVKHDPKRVNPIYRPNLPEVYRVNPHHAVLFTAAMQLLWYEVNRLLTGLDPLLWRKLGGNALYLFNKGKGFPGHADYVNGLELSRPVPRAPIMLICGGADVTGVKSYSLMQGIQQVLTSRSPSLLTAKNILILNGIDTRKPLPSADEVITQRLYYTNVTIQADGTIGRFPQGQGKDTFTPLFYSQPIWLPLAELEYIPLGAPIPSPYTV